MSEIEQALHRIREATERLLASTAVLSDSQVREPSLLPEWTRGHVLAHIARNADGLANLLRWASTRTEIPMYKSREARDADIEAGAARGAAELAADVRDSAAAFTRQAATVPESGWTVLVRALRGDPFPAAAVLTQRLSEVEIHHVDLAAGYGPGDWPDDFVCATLPRVAEAFAGRADAPACRIAAHGMSDTLTVGPAAGAGPGRAGDASTDGGPDTGTVPLVTGPAHELLAWLLGRSRGDRLAVHLASAVPVMPPWR